MARRLITHPQRSAQRYCDFTITEMPNSRLILYAITLAVYTPYLLYSLRKKYYSRFPVVFFTFLGMYVYNALGSIYVFVPYLHASPFGKDYFSNDFAIMIILQGIIFYCITLPYTRLARPITATLQHERSASSLLFSVLGLATGAIIVLYVSKVGVPPGLRIASTDMTTQQVLQYRMSGTFALTDYYIYNLGFMTLPLITAALAGTLYLRTRIKVRYVILIVACMIVSTFPGGKGSITRVSILLLITGLLYRHHYPKVRGAARGRWKAAAALVLATGCVVIAMYRLYYGADVGLGELFDTILFKVFGGVPETIAGLISYCDAYGYLGGRTFTNIHGLLGHEMFDMNVALHIYMFGPGGATAYPAVTEGYINFGWPGFFASCSITYALVIVIDRLFVWLPKTDLTFSILALCCLIATEVSQLSWSATFVSITLATVVGLLLMLDRFGVWISPVPMITSGWRVPRLRA